MTSKPLVSVWMLTYNHEDFIRYAIEGVMSQKTDFAFELVIGEDHSSDNTLAICTEYAEKYRGIIKVLPAEENIGMARNFVRTLNHCTGKYIAMCEGDDYWTDPYKLSEQVKILEGDQSIIGVVTNANMIDENNNVFREWAYNVKGNKEGRITLKDYLTVEGNFPTLTIVFRNVMNYDKDIPAFFYKSGFTDAILYILLLLRGDFYYLNKLTANYRIHPNQVTRHSNLLERAHNNIYTNNNLKTILPAEYSRFINNSFGYRQLSYYYARVNLIIAIYWSLRYLKYTPANSFKHFKDILYLYRTPQCD